LIATQKRQKSGTTIPYEDLRLLLLKVLRPMARGVARFIAKRPQLFLIIACSSIGHRDGRQNQAFVSSYAIETIDLNRKKEGCQTIQGVRHAPMIGYRSGATQPQAEKRASTCFVFQRPTPQTPNII
jgi:hypothetical protein